MESCDVMTLTVHGIIKENQTITLIPVLVCYVFNMIASNFEHSFVLNTVDVSNCNFGNGDLSSFFEIFGWVLLGILRLSLGTRWMMVNDLGRSPVYRFPQRCMLYRKLYAALHTYDTWYL